MSIESKEFIAMRNDQLAAAAREAQRRAQFDAPTHTPEPGIETSRGRCVCCGEWTLIPVRQHVCLECWEDVC